MISQFRDSTLLLFRLAWRNIWRQKKRSLVLISSAAAGITGLLFTMASINGFSDSMVNSAIESGIGHVQLRPAGYNESRDGSLILKNTADLKKKLLPLKKIRHSFRLDREAILRSGNISQGVSLSGVDPGTETDVSSFAKWIVSGIFFSSKSEQTAVCVIGFINAEKMDLDIGDYAVITISSADKNLKSFRCIIEGIFHSPSEPVDKYIVLTRRSFLSALYFGDSKIDDAGYAVFLGEDMKFADSYLSEIENLLTNSSGIELLTWKILEPGFMRLTELMDSFYWIFYSIIMFGFAFALFESVTMSVFERTREMGVFSAMGTKPSFLFFMVIFESVLLAFLGSLAGTLFGWIVTFYFQVNGLSLAAFAKGMENYGKAGSTLFPFLKISDITAGIELTLMISFLSAIYPAWRAVRIPPVRAIYNR